MLRSAPSELGEVGTSTLYHFADVSFRLVGREISVIVDPSLWYLLVWA